MVNVPKVLIVDHNMNTCLFAAQALTRAGYLVSTATEGREGLAKALREGPHCLILEVVLPEINGFDVCRQLRARDPHHLYAIILTSSRDTSLDRSWALRQGADRYLPRPFSEEALVQLVADVLAERFYPPVTPRQVPSIRQTSQQEALPNWLFFIPHRRENPQLLKFSNPLTESVVIADKQARRLYAAIDGKRNVEALCRVTRLEMKGVFKALRILLAGQRIQLYTPEGLPADDSLFFEDH
jgi:CheY-like chemotaxis protein